MRIVLTIVSLSGFGGGMERSATHLANEFRSQGHDVTILTFSDLSRERLYPLAKGVEVRQLDLLYATANKFMAVKRMLHSAWKLRKQFKELDPDVIFAFGDQVCVLTLAGNLGRGAPVVVAERTHPEHYPIGRGWGGLRKALYPRAAALVAQTESIREWYEKNIPGSRAVVIPNPVQPSPAVSDYAERERKKVIGVGMLTEVKRFPVFVEAFASLAKKHLDWDLVVYGEGPDRELLEGLAGELGLKGRVFLPGRVENIARHMAGADLFVLTSRTEGFPNALCEAMACGLPVVSFDCPSGPAEIIRHGVDGLLVRDNDTAGLASAMDRLMADPVLRKAMGRKGLEISERFSPGEINGTWTGLLREVAG